MLAVLIGKSGCGKSTIEKHFQKMISFTTRKPRENEQDGVDYYFLKRPIVEKEIEKLNRGEKSLVRQYSTYDGEIYGTTVQEIERIKQSDIMIGVMNLDGAQTMKKIGEEDGFVVKLIWVDVDENVRIARILKRAKETGESESSIQKRIYEDHRNHEIQYCDHVLPNNGAIEEAIQQLKQIARM